MFHVKHRKDKNMKQIITAKTEFSPEEKHALKVISDIDCKGVFCNRCPFEDGNNECIKAKIHYIADKHCI